MPPRPPSCPIERLAPGEIATISAIDRAGLDPETAQRLHELGFDDGVDIELLHRAPFGGDPLAVRVGNMVVALRVAMARLIDLVVVDSAAEQVVVESAAELPFKLAVALPAIAAE